ncbi:putative mitochondrial hypothetical protein [Leptomonas pyrrhocoris]|uniref:Uncharacterized protein n=1 Tax=Leptomonas pyrrhocoris TaxID=157538 RepID=A0A0N0DWC5_LEPPY|nr:putative mitochondrial hypothetical protein [Leptomonas pyrrhocoris]KPA81592.1 putative mitochondrial hypothetical protein [Leptomonas pyrrhocoris]|eukprot:XP_015660031.1 putative mitochondrial hypothetical protein [Leptomonas pyrrhocoris]
MAFPPCYHAIVNAVDEYLTKGSQVQGAQLDAAEEGDPNCLNVFPFAQKGCVGAHLTYNCAPLNTTVKSKVSPNFKSWKEYLPSITYTAKINGTSDVFMVDAATGVVNVTAMHPVVTASCRTSLLDGGATNVTAATCIQPQLYGGASLSYDPKRSGLRDFTAAVVRYSCPNIYKGDLMGKYNLRNGFSVHMRVPVHPYMDVAVAAERQRFIAGIQGRSPCGARLMLNTNVTDGTYTITTIRNFGDIWKFTLTMTAPFSGSGNAAAPRYGLKFTHMDAVD